MSKLMQTYMDETKQYQLGRYLYGRALRESAREVSELGTKNPPIPIVVN